jgi:uncharacterized membrane protein
MEFLAQFHPKVVHFPIALLLLYVLLESIGIIFKKEFYQKAAHLVLFLGVLGALAAVLTGEQAEEAFEYFNKASGELMEKHEYYANLTIWYFAILLVLRTVAVLGKKFTGIITYVFLVLALTGVYFVYWTGEMGGDMVYKHGVGTQYKIQMEEMEDE